MKLLVESGQTHEQMVTCLQRAEIEGRLDEFRRAVFEGLRDEHERARLAAKLRGEPRKSILLFPPEWCV